MLGEWRPQSGIVALYRGENVNDSSGNGKTLTNNNSVAFNPGKFGNAFDFGNPNTTKYMSRADTFINSGGDFTVGFIHKAPDASNAYISFKSDLGGGGSDEYYMGISSSGGLDFHHCNSDGSEGDGGGTFPGFDASKWSRIFFTVTKSGSDYIKRIFCNGALAHESTVTGKTSGKLGDFNIARFIAETTIVMDGLCEEVVIMNRALTKGEARRHEAWVTGKLM